MEITGAELRCRAARLPRVSLTYLPTPLEELPRFSEMLGGPRVLIKRDDFAAPDFGGNKIRHNEFILALAKERGAEMVVWGASVQSNNCRQTATACAKLGLKCHLVLSTADRSPEVQGNLLLDYIVGATVEFTDAPMGSELWAAMGRAAERFRRQGINTLAGTDPAVRPSGAVSYALALAEIIEQCGQRGVAPDAIDAIYVSSCGVTGSGLFLGKRLLGLPGRVRSIMPIVWAGDNLAQMSDIANRAAELLGCDARLDRTEIDATPDFIGAAYGLPTPAGMEATRAVAQTEGILLDPVYTAKAMAGLIADIRSGRLQRGQNVVFVHTGGTPALFAYQREFVQEFVTGNGRTVRAD